MKMSVQRWGYSMRNSIMEERDYGFWVKYDDYQALEAKLDERMGQEALVMQRVLRLEAQLDAVRALPEKLRRMAGNKGLHQLESRALYTCANEHEQALQGEK